MTDSKEVAILRKRYRLQKQSTILASSIVAFICLALVLIFFGMSIMFGTYSSSTSKSVQGSYKLPCLESTDTSSNVVYPAKVADVTVRIMNASGLSGFATAVAKAIKTRGFSVLGADSLDPIDETQIRFGANAIREAYTIADHFVSPVMVLDDRPDGLIDVVIGRSFTDLKDADIVTSTDITAGLPQPEKCVNVNDIAPAPMLEHDTTVVAPYITTTKGSEDAKSQDLKETTESDKE